MAFNFNGTPSAEVTIDEINQTKIKVVTVFSNQQASLTVGTVPANRTWKVVGVLINTGGAADCEVFLNAVSIGKYYQGSLNVNPFYLGFVSGCYLGEILTAGQTITRTLAQTVGTTVTAYYIEEVV